ncbi:MAG: DUF58 domain-containing protein [Crenarchaeota archaeon]|nr:DUF58 domain-containing protein [Thermoproteota archaeon]MCR8453429.1 DUF58 domain-containing protein [Thermoproteota archaeon]MCR8454926.1 DUF58 domain-containing protein [Thermoproteota archaeon]MCR8463161.1 DUF58 domain-containing protein [Thermoproteota archaeon]MCR8470493.1 DUF58 domain-containing protein [Thermoproteota archaeon]
MKIRLTNVAGVYLLISFFGFYLSFSLYQLRYLLSFLASIGINVGVLFPNIDGAISLAPWLLVFSGILLSAFILSYLRFSMIARFALLRLEAKREISSDKIFQGEMTSVCVKIRNPTFFDLDRILIVDVVPDTFDITFGENYADTFIRAGGQAEMAYVLRAASRGVHLIGPLNILLRDKMHFFVSSIEIPIMSEVRVFPSYSDIRRLEIAQKSMGGFLPGQHTILKIKGAGYDFHQLRQFDHSDPIKLIDWKAFARLGKLLVREYLGERIIKLYIIIDTSYTMGYGYRRLTKLDFATRAGALIAYLAKRLQDFFGVMLFSSTVHNFVKAARGRGHFMRVLSVLAEAEPEGIANLPGAIRYLISHEPRSCFLIIISDLESDIGAIVEGVKIALANKLKPTIIVPMSPFFEIPSPGSSFKQMFRDAVMIEYLRRINAIASKITQYGVKVAPVSPQNIVSVVLDSYIRAKHRFIGAI